MLAYWRPVGLVTLLAVVLALVLSVAMQLDLPDPTGPYTVGRTNRLWEDPSRPEVLTDTPDDHREIPVIIWYPAEDGTGTPSPYFPDLDRTAQALTASGEVSAPVVLGLRYIRSHERLDAQLSHAASSYPVILLSPGNATNVEFYSALAGDLASHGYVVVGVNHPYDVAAVALQEGRVAQFVEGPLEFALRQPWVSERIAVRTADLLFVLAQLKALSAAEDPAFYERLDLSQLGVMGHSLGGITAAEVCRADAAIRACLNFDGLQQGGPFSTSSNPTPPEQPFMMITKELSLHPVIKALFEEIPTGSYRVVIPEASHESFADGALLQPSLLPTVNQADRVLSLTRTYTLAFFEQTLRGQRSRLLEKSRQDSDVWLEVYPSR